jgi:hypothetical protein
MAPHFPSNLLIPTRDRRNVSTMKRIIEGVAYDTDTATEIASGNHGHELSDAHWTLYKTRHGAFFEVVAGHDGVAEGFYRLTNKEAREFLELNANHLVEVHFGAMPEARPLRFSRKTLIAAIKVMERMTHAEFSEFMLELSPALIASVGDDNLSLRKRLNNLTATLDKLPDRQLDDGELLRDVLVAKAAAMLLTETNWVGMPNERSAAVDAFIRALDIDGFVVSEGTIQSALPVDLNLPEAQNEIDRLLHKHGMGVPRGHLDQALGAHARGDWAAANSQLRSFVEGLLDEIAVKLDPSASSLQSGHSRRERLATLGFLSRDLNEWNGQGTGFINGLMKRLHPQGSHPGLSDPDDCTFRLYVVLITTKLLLARFDALARQAPLR